MNQIEKYFLFMILIVFLGTALAKADSGEITPPFGYLDNDNDNVNDLFRDADGDGIEDGTAQKYSHTYSFIDVNGDGKNDIFQDANGDGINDLIGSLMNAETKEILFALDANNDGNNDVDGQVIDQAMINKHLNKNRNSSGMDNFVDKNGDGLDDRRMWRQGSRGRGRGGGGNGSSRGHHSFESRRPWNSSKNMSQTGSGWNSGSRYCKKYITNKIENMQGQLTNIDREVPLKGMDIGLVLQLESNQDSVFVHLGPEWLLARKNIQMKPGDSITVTGSRCKIKRKPAFIAYEVTIDDKTFILRDNKGNLVYE